MKLGYRVLVTDETERATFGGYDPSNGLELDRIISQEIERGIKPEHLIITVQVRKS